MPRAAAPACGWLRWCLPRCCIDLLSWCVPRPPPEPPSRPPRRYTLSAVTPAAVYPYTLARLAMDLPATSRTRKELEARLPALVSAWEAEVAETARRHHRRARLFRRACPPTPSR